VLEISLNPRSVPESAGDLASMLAGDYEIEAVIVSYTKSLFSTKFLKKILGPILSKIVSSESSKSTL